MSVQAKTPKAGTGDDKELVILVQFTDQALPAPARPRPSGPTTTSVPPAASTTSTRRPAGEPVGLWGRPPRPAAPPYNGVTNWISLPYAHPNTGVKETRSEQYVADAIAATNGCVNYDAAFDT